MEELYNLLLDHFGSEHSQKIRNYISLLEKETPYKLTWYAGAQYIEDADIFTFSIEHHKELIKCFL